MPGVKKVALIAKAEGVGALTGVTNAYLKWEIDRHGVTLVDSSDAEIILVSITDLRDMPMLRRARRAHKKAKIVVGGMGAFSPHAIGKYADAVVVGEGWTFLEALFTRGYEAALAEPNVWIDGDDRRVIPSYDYPWDFPIVATEEGIAVVLSRGCKKRCRFCQVGWTTKLIEHPDPDRICNRLHAIRARRKDVFRYVANDFLGLSFVKRLPPSNFASVTMSQLKKGGIPKQNMIRLGVEGVSERLRKSVSKPISKDDLIEQTIRMTMARKTVKLFIIAGLPGERAEDWEELKEVIQTWKRWTSGCLLEVSFCAFIPMSATPLSNAALSDDYWQFWQDFRYWFKEGHGFCNRVVIQRPGLPEKRNALAELEIGLPLEELRKERDELGPNHRIVYPYEDACIKTIARKPWRD